MEINISNLKFILFNSFFFLVLILTESRCKQLMVVFSKIYYLLLQYTKDTFFTIRDNVPFC